MSEAREVGVEPQRYDQFEDEIELMDYLKVLWKWKYLIIVGTLVCAIGAAVVSLNMTKVYGITTILEPGMLKVTDEGKIIHIDSPQNIKAVIETGALNGHILKNIKAPNKEDVPDSVEVKVTIHKGTNALEVLYETPNVDLGFQIMKNLSKALLERYGKLIKHYQEEYSMQIIEKSSLLQISDNAILNLRAELKAKQDQIRNLEERKSEVELEIGRIGKNTDLLISERNLFLSTTKEDNNILSALIYSNTIQQNISYLNSLKDDVSNINSKIYNEKVGVEKLENAVKDKQITKKDISIEIKSLEFKKNSIQNIQIIKTPKISESPIKPKTRLNVMLAGVVGLFLTVFLAFFVEYISKYKSREDER